MSYRSSFLACCCLNRLASAALKRLFYILFSLRAVQISLEIYDNQLSKWENRMLVIKIIKLHEIHPTSSNIYISPSCILIKHYVSVAIRLRLLWWKQEKKWTWLEGFLLYVKFLVVLKHLIMICKVAADTPGMPEDSLAGFSCFWNRWPKENTLWFAKATFLLRGVCCFPTSFMNELALLSSETSSQRG